MWEWLSGLAGSILVLDSQCKRHCSHHTVQAAIRHFQAGHYAEIIGQRRQRGKTPGTQAAKSAAKNIQQGIDRLKSGGGIHEHAPLFLKKCLRRGQEAPHRSQAHIVRVEPVDHLVVTGFAQALHQFIVMQRMFLKNMDATRHQSPGQLRATSAVDTRAHHHAGNVDI